MGTKSVCCSNDVSAQIDDTAIVPDERPVSKKISSLDQRVRLLEIRMSQAKPSKEPKKSKTALLVEIQKTVEKLEIAVEKSLDQSKSDLVLPEIIEKVQTRRPSGISRNRQRGPPSRGKPPASTSVL